MSTDKERIRFRNMLPYQRKRRTNAWERRGFTEQESWELAGSNLQLDHPAARQLAARRRRLLRNLRKEGYNEESITAALEDNYFLREDIGTLIEEIYEGNGNEVLLSR